MKIGIDARFYGITGKGLGRYTQKLIENLERIDQVNNYFIFLRKDNFNEYQPRNKNFQKVLADYQWYSFSEQINMPRILKKYNPDLVHFSHFNVPFFYRRKFVVTIHDLILLHFPTIKGTTLPPLFYWLKFFAYRIIIGSALRRAQKIITVSEFTKNDILRNYEIPENKIAVTCEAADEFFVSNSEKDETILRKYGIIKPYLLYVGNAYPHKNLERLVLAFEKIKKKFPEMNLVLVGRKDYFYSRLGRFAEKKKIGGIIFSDSVPDTDLGTVYQDAEIFVFPSLYEGFGIPPLEAMARKTPVTSSDHPCMREILGEAAYYFNGEDIDEIANAVAKVLQDKNLREKLIFGGNERVKKYDWKNMARLTLDIYRNS